MGWFRRNRDGGDAPADAPAEDTAAEPEPAPFVAARNDGPSAGDWMAMPPMPRTVGPAPSRATSLQRLSDMMTTRRPLALTGTLGHRVSPLAPAGSVEGLATAVSTPHEVDGGGDLTLRTPHAAPATHADHVDDGAGYGDGAHLSSTAAAVVDDLPPVQREVAVTASSTPSLRTITQARLPQQQPARALHEPLPLPGNDIGAENPPRPLAVVQRQTAATAAASATASTSASASTPSPAATPTFSSPADSASPASAGNTNDQDDRDDRGDAPVGGTPIRPVSAPEMNAVDGGDTAGVQTGDGTTVDLPLAATAPSTPSIPMEDVMPPIQPRAIQRRAAEAAGASARPETAADAPLPPLPGWARPSQSPQGEAAPPAPSSPSPATPAATSAPSTPSMPLQHPTVQREAVPSATSEEHYEGDGHDHGAHDHAAHDDAGPADLPISREALPGAAPVTTAPSTAATGGGDEEEHAASAPLAGGAAPIAALPDALDSSSIAELADVTEEAPPVELPLHSSGPGSSGAGGGAPAADEPEAAPSNRWNAPSERMPSDRVPEPEPSGDDAPAIQRMADGSAPELPAEQPPADSVAPLLGDRPLTLHTGSPAAADAFGRAGGDISPPARPEAAGESLPLVPGASSMGAGPALSTPPSASAATPPGGDASAPFASAAGASRAVQTMPLPTRSSPAAAAGTGAAAVQRQAGNSTGSGAGTSNGTGNGNRGSTGSGNNPGGGVALPLRALPSLPERPAASPGAGGPLTEPLPVTPPAGAPPIPAMDAPLAFHAMGSPMSGVDGSATSALAAVQTLPATAAATAPATAPAPSARGAAMPLQQPVQRSADGPGASHTAAAAAARTTSASAAPSIGELAVASGLGVVQPDGSVLFTRQEPAPSADGMPIQRELTTAPAATTVSTSASAAPGAAGDSPPATSPDLDQLARNLLPRFRRLLANEIRTSRGRVGDAPWNRH